MDLENSLSLYNISCSVYVSTMDIFQQNANLFSINKPALEATALLRPIFLKKGDILFDFDYDHYMRDLNQLVALNDDYNNWLQIYNLYFPQFSQSMEWWSSIFQMVTSFVGKKTNFKRSPLLNNFINNHIIDYDTITCDADDKIQMALQVLDSFTHSEEKIKKLYDGLSAYDKYIYDILKNYDEVLLRFCVLRLGSGGEYQIFFDVLRKINSDYTMEEIQLISDELQSLEKYFPGGEFFFKSDYEIKTLGQLVQIKLYTEGQRSQ